MRLSVNTYVRPLSLQVLDAPKDESYRMIANDKCCTFATIRDSHSNHPSLPFVDARVRPPLIIGHLSPKLMLEQPTLIRINGTWIHIPLGSVNIDVASHSTLHIQHI